MALTKRGEMIRNIDADFVKQAFKEKDIKLRSVCGALGKSDNYLGNMRRSGIRKSDMSKIAALLDMNVNDPRFYLGGVAVTDDELDECDTPSMKEIRDSNEIHKIRSDMAKFRKDAEIISRAILAICRELDITINGRTEKGEDKE